MSKPIKSRHGLTRCTVCRAHIQAGDRPSDADCPFCGANLLRGGSRITQATTRGGVLAASLLAFSLTACGGGGDEPVEPAPSTQSDNTGGETPSGDDQYSDDPADDPNGVAEYGMPADDQYSDDPADDPNMVAEYGVSPDVYEEEPADEMRPTARYGMAPMR